MAIRKNADGSITVGIIREEVEAKAPASKADPEVVDKPKRTRKAKQTAE